MLAIERFFRVAEALNHIGSLDLDMLVVLNDNDMSISEAIGAFSNYLARLLSGKSYADLRAQGRRLLQHLPPARSQCLAVACCGPDAVLPIGHWRRPRSR